MHEGFLPIDTEILYVTFKKMTILMFFSLLCLPLTLQSLERYLITMMLDIFRPPAALFLFFKFFFILPLATTQINHLLALTWVTWTAFWWVLGLHIQSTALLSTGSPSAPSKRTMWWVQPQDMVSRLCRTHVVVYSLPLLVLPPALLSTPWLKTLYHSSLSACCFLSQECPLSVMKWTNSKLSFQVGERYLVTKSFLNPDFQPARAHRLTCTLSQCFSSVPHFLSPRNLEIVCMCVCVYVYTCMYVYVYV